MDFVTILFNIFALCPWIFFGIVYVLYHRIIKKKKKANRIAMDFTTILFFWSIPMLLHSFWKIEAVLLTLIIAIVIALVIILVAWISAKEITLRQLSRHIWRMYFILFSASYFVIIGIFVVQKIINYIS